MNRIQRIVIVLATLIPMGLSGCAEGPFWKMGAYLPWVQAKWQAEEQIAETIHAKKKNLRALASSARSFSNAQKEQAIVQLTQVVQNERILQLRVEAAHVLGELDTQSAEVLLQELMKDSDAEVRIAAVKSLAKRRTETAGKELIRVLGSDTDKDVRSATIRGLANFPGRQTIQALTIVLDEHEPALQYRAMDTLAQITSEKIGPSVPKWKEYLAAKGFQSNQIANTELNRAFQ